MIRPEDVAREVEEALKGGDAARAEAFASALSRVPLGPSLLAQRAVDLARTDPGEAALRLCSLTRRIAAGDGMATGILGYAYHALKRFDDWLECGLEGVRLAPERHYGHAAALAAIAQEVDPAILVPLLERWAAAFGHAGDVPRALADVWQRFADGPDRTMFRYVANIFLALGAAEQAIEAFTQALDPLDDEDNRARVQANHTRIAPGYDSNRLHRQIVARVVERGRRFSGRNVGAALDLCCGTGLAGPGLRPLAGRLVGVDMTPAMLEQAKAKGCYDLLAEDDACVWLAATAERFDLVVMADAMQYFRDIVPLFAGIGRVLNPGGILVFSADPVTDARFQAMVGAGEYAHSRALLRQAAAGAGLSERQMDVDMHRGHPGFYGVFTRS